MSKDNPYDRGGNISRDTSYSDKKGLKDLKGEFSKLSTPKHEDHAKAFAAMTTKSEKDRNPGNSDSS